jgi:hypothetical protein
MAIDGGTVTRALVDVRDIALLVDAGLPRLKVHVLPPGVCIVAGVQIRLAAAEADVMLRAAERTTEATVADMVALPEALAPTDAVKTAEEAPPDIKTDAGTVTCGLVLLSVTVTPPDATGPVIETTQLLALPAATVPGEQTTEESVGCNVTVRVKVADAPL